MNRNELEIAVRNKNYFIEIEEIDPRDLFGKIFLAKIKSQDEKYFTYKFQFGNILLSTIEEDAKEYILKKIIDITTDLINDDEYKDKLIKITRNKKDIIDAPDELKKHSNFYQDS